jgi:hypothetical protein
MSEVSPSRATIDAWQANQLRLTFLATPDVLPLKPTGWWESVMEGPPERIEDRPKVGYHVEEGPCLNGTLTISVQANRIDWALGTIIDLERGFEDVPAMGSFLTLRDEFLAKVLRWLPSAPTCHRVAFGGRLLLPVESREAGYRLLAAYLPFAPDPKGSMELKYQINRPRQSRVQPDLLINRLQAWSLSFFRIGIVPGGERLPLPEVTEAFSISLEPDISTDAQFFDRLPADRLPDLIKELANLATELAAEGDRP